MFSSSVSVEPQYGQRKIPRCSWTSCGGPALRGVGGAKPDSRSFSRPAGVIRAVDNDLDLGLGAELAHLRRHLVAHHFERGAAEERRRELDTHMAVLHRDVTHDAEVDERDHRDLGVGNLAERLPDGGFCHHAAPTTDRRTMVISSQSSGSSGPRSPRSSTSGLSSSSASTYRGSSFSRSCHICACIRWYASSRSIFAARPTSSESSEFMSSCSRCSSACS